MTSQPSEEKYPLLLLYVEEGGKRSEYPRRVVFADRTRGKNVVQGAASIITQWPGHVTSCWLTSIVLASSFVFLSLLLMIASMGPLIFSQARPRCIRDVSKQHSNRTVHLVNEGTDWHPEQLNILKYIAEKYPEYDIHVVIFEPQLESFANKQDKKAAVKIIVDGDNITNTPEATTENPEVKRINKTDEDFNGLFFYTNPFRNLNAFSIFEKFKKNNSPERFRRSVDSTKENKIESFESIANKYSNIVPETTNYKHYFINTPLQYYWMSLDKNMLLFASRIQELWQYGGISFNLPHPEHIHESKVVNNNALVKQEDKRGPTITKTTDKSVSKDEHLRHIIVNSKSIYEKLPDELVSIDGKGLHMATKTACHTFFGEMMIKLLAQMDSISVPTLIQGTLDAFCKRGAVDSEYCKAIQN